MLYYKCEHLKNPHLLLRKAELCVIQLCMCFERLLWDSTPQETRKRKEEKENPFALGKRKRTLSSNTCCFWVSIFIFKLKLYEGRRVTGHKLQLSMPLEYARYSWLNWIYSFIQGSIPQLEGKNY